MNIQPLSYSDPLLTKFLFDFRRGHLHGRLHYGDNIEDEWFSIALIFRLTASLDVVASLRDVDGEILLIEAADKLPQWAQEPGMIIKTY